MLSSITGKITAYEPGSIVIETANIGFLLNVPATLSCTLDQQITVQVYMHWNQEQGPALYGFQTEMDKRVFLLVISCSGIGPKIALAVLSDIGSASFVRAVQQGDADALSSVSGIGQKKAEQMIVQLKHKIDKFIKTHTLIDQHADIMDVHSVSQVLTSLNYSRNEIHAAINWLKEQNKEMQVPFDKLVRQALSFLAKKA